MEILNFGEYLEAVESILESKYCIDLFDAGIEFDDIGEAQDDGMSPDDFVNWFGTKYNLIANET